MEPAHADQIALQFPEAQATSKIICLSIPDIYVPMEPALIAELHRKLEPHLGVHEQQVPPASPPDS